MLCDKNMSIRTINTHGALKVLSCVDQADRSFGARIKALSFASGKTLMGNSDLNLGNATKICVIEAPRGGASTCDGLYESLREGLPEGRVERYRSLCKTNRAQPFATDFSFMSYSHVFLSDGIASTGQTMIDHIVHIPGDWKGQLIVFVNGCAHLAFANISAFCKDRNRSLIMYCNRLFEDDECTWVRDEDGRDKYFIGVNRAKNIDYHIPDFGDQFELGGVLPDQVKHLLK